MQHLKCLLLRLFCCIFNGTLTGYIADSQLVRLLFIFLNVVYNHVDDYIAILKLISHFDIFFSASDRFKIIRRDFCNFGKELRSSQFGHLPLFDGVVEDLLISLAYILPYGTRIIFCAILQLH